MHTLHHNHLPFSNICRSLYVLGGVHFGSRNLAQSWTRSQPAVYPHMQRICIILKLQSWAGCWAGNQLLFHLYHSSPRTPLWIQIHNNKHTSGALVQQQCHLVLSASLLSRIFSQGQQRPQGMERVLSRTSKNL